MLRTDKPIYKAILVLNLLFVVAGIVLSVIEIISGNSDVTRMLTLVASIACLAFATFYIISGYTKDAAKYYKVYGTLLAVKFLLSILSSSITSAPTFGIMVIAISLVIVLVLILSENLGKEKSFILCGLHVILGVALLVFALSKGNVSIIYIISDIVNIDLACLFGIMTYAKYLDKAERGTK